MINTQLSPTKLEGYTKVVLPNSTTALGINSKRSEVIFDIGAFETTINFDVTLESAERTESRDYLIDRALNFYCDSCKYYEHSTSYSIGYYLDLYYFRCILFEIKKLYELSTDVLQLLNYTKVSKYLTSSSTFIASITTELLKLIETTFPINILYRNMDSITKIVLGNNTNESIENRLLFISTIFSELCHSNLWDSEYILRKVTSTEIVEYIENSKNSISQILDNINTIFSENSSQDKINTRVLKINNKHYLYNTLKHMVNLEKYAILSKSTQYTYNVQEVIYYIVAEYKVIITKIIRLQEKLYGTLEFKPICPGIDCISKLSECIKYYDNNSDITIPNDLTDAYYAEDTEKYEEEIDQKVNKELTLLIPTHYYKISYKYLKVKTYRDIIPDFTLGRLEMYPLCFPNINSEGEICYEDNNQTAIASIKSGKFSTIVEAFWGSVFNHDLAQTHDIYSSEYIEYTFEYHKELINTLQDIYGDNVNEDYLNNKSYSYATSEWIWVDLTKKEVYMKVHYDYDKSIFIILDKESREVEQEISLSLSN